MGGAVSVKPLTRSIITVLPRQFTPQLVAEHPAMPASGRNQQIQTIAVAVPTRPQGLDPALGQAFYSHTFSHTVLETS